MAPLWCELGCCSQTVRVVVIKLRRISACTNLNMQDVCTNMQHTTLKLKFKYLFLIYIYIYIYIYAIANASQLPARVRADRSVEPCDTKRLSLSLLLTGSRRGRSIESSLERRCRLNLNYKLAQASEVATVTNTMTDSGRNQPHCQVTGESRWADPRARQL